MQSAPASGPAPGRPGRRALLVAGLATLVAGTSGCRVRLEDDAPPIPFIPTRDPIPAEPTLMWLLEDCRNLAAQGDGAVYGEQVSVLRSALYRAGIPIDTLDAALTPPTPTAQPSSTGTGPTGTDPATTDQTAPDPTPADPTTADPATTDPTPADPTTADPTPETGAEVSPTSDTVETPGSTGTGDAADATTTPTTSNAVPHGPTDALRRIDDLAGCGAGLFPLVVSLLGQRWAAATTAGSVVPPTASSANPEQKWEFPHLATGFVELTRAAVYAFQIVAAQSREETRELALVALAEVRALEQEQIARAGDKVAIPPIAYPLPFPVNSPESAGRLATHVLKGLLEGYGGLLVTVTGSTQSETIRDIVAWIGRVAARGTEWGVPLAAFPGLRTGA